MSDLSIVNLSTYTSPKIVENRTDSFVSYGEDNNYFQFLIDRYNGSATNNAIINGMSEMIFGKGLDATDSNKKPEAYAQMITLLHDDCVRRVSSDLKLMGQCAMQIIYSKDRKTIARVEHIAIETLRAEKCNEKGEVEAYYMHPDWANYKKSDKLTRIEAFGYGKEAIQIYYVKPYRAGFKYYSPVDYQGGIQYAELEEEISNYHLNNILNGLSPSMLINFNNGTPDPEQRQLIENRIQSKFSGSSNSGKFILSFNDNSESAASIEPIQLSDAHNQYQFLSDESMRKVMVSHRVVSPMLLGVKDSSGFGNNADELKTASILMDNTVIRPFQTLLIKAFDQILAYNDISLNLYFKTLQPLEFMDLGNVEDKETKEEETGVKLAKENEEFNDEEMLNALEGENITDEWELVEKREYDEDNEDAEVWANRLLKEKQTALQKLADFVKSKPNGESILDKSYYKVRYEYSEKYSSDNSRNFCETMMGRTSKGVIYRKEDIEKAGKEGVNSSFGHKGQSYSLFRFKGGVNCGHYWNENLYRLKSKTEKYISKGKEVESIPKSYVPKGRKYDDSKVAPKDMENSGRYPLSEVSLGLGYKPSQKRGSSGKWVKENKTCLDLTKLSDRRDATTTKQANDYSKALRAAKDSDPVGYWSVDNISPEDAKKGVIINKDYGGLMIGANGDIKGLYKNPESKAKGVGMKLLNQAINNGGRTLDNFDGYLTKIYVKEGFRITGRTPFNEEYAPKGWDKNLHGTPDIVSMIYDPKRELNIREQRFTGDDGYDEMIRHRNSSLNICN